MNTTTTRIFLLAVLSSLLLSSCSDELRLEQSFLHFAYDYSPEPSLDLLDASANVDLSTLRIKSIQSTDRVDFCIEGLKFEDGNEISIQELTQCPLLDCTDERPILTGEGQEVEAYLNENLSIIIHTTQSLTSENWKTLEYAVSDYASLAEGKINLITKTASLASDEGQAFQAFVDNQENINIITLEEQGAESLNDMVNLSIRSNQMSDSQDQSALSSLIIVTNEIDTRSIDHQISNYLSTYLLRVVDEQYSILDYTSAEVDRALYSQSFIATNNEGFESSLSVFKETFFSNQRVVFSLEGANLLNQTTIKIHLAE
jgi:hypothetical protein